MCSVVDLGADYCVGSFFYFIILSAAHPLLELFLHLHLQLYTLFHIQKPEQKKGRSCGSVCLVRERERERESTNIRKAAAVRFFRSVAFFTLSLVQDAVNLEFVAFFTSLDFQKHGDAGVGLCALHRLLAQGAAV